MTHHFVSRVLKSIFKHKINSSGVFKAKDKRLKIIRAYLQLVNIAM